MARPRSPYITPRKEGKMGEMAMRRCGECGCLFDRQENCPPFEKVCKICLKLGSKALVPMILRLEKERSR